jgi:uncharacterized protein YggE
MRRRWLAAVAAAFVAVLPAARVRGDDNGITVSGSGEVSAKPTQVEFEIRTGGSAELTGDAIAKYRDAKRRTLDAFAKQQMKNLVIEERAIALTNSSGLNPQQAMFNAGQAPAAKPVIDISRSIRVVLKDIQDMPEEELMATIGRVLDTAKDAGATIGPASDASALLARMYGQQMSAAIATFVLDDAGELREKAYRNAMEQARTRAERLAALAHVKLGPVLSVQETAVAGGADTNPQQQMIMAMYGIRDANHKDDLRVTSDTFSEIPVRVNLQVRFGIESE